MCKPNFLLAGAVLLFLTLAGFSSAAQTNDRIRGDQQGRNVVTTRSESGDPVVLKAVNPQYRPVAVQVQLKEGFSPRTASMSCVVPGSCIQKLDTAPVFTNYS